jgi:hypothetical protein
VLDAAAPVPPGLIGPDGQPSATRFAVYRNNVVLGLIDALKAAFPVVCALVGEDFFAAMARAHAVETPPASPVMHDYGADFPAFIARFAPAASLPYLADVARLEWAWVEAYHAAEAWPLSPASIARVKQAAIPRARLLLHPSARLVRSAWPVVAMWRMHGADETAAPAPDAGGQDALILRPGAEVEIRTLPPGAAAFITALLAGAPIAAAAEAGFAEDATFDLAYAFTGLIESGAIIGIEAPSLQLEPRP